MEKPWASRVFTASTMKGLSSSLTETKAQPEVGRWVPPPIWDLAKARAKVEAISAGAAAEVDYTPAKMVSKPKGAPPGLVMLIRHKTLRIRLDREIFERIRAGS